MNEHIKILMVEDSADDGKLIEHTLKKGNLKYTLKRIETEKELVFELDNFTPELIITDYSLPSFNALRVLEIVKLKNLSIPIILVTGSQTEEVAVQCMKKGADDYILKQNLLRLPSAVKNILEKNRIEKEKESAQKAQRESEEIYKLISENSSDLICMLDRDGYFLYLNHSFSKVLGFDQSELLMSNYFQLVHPNDREYVIKMFEQTFITRKPQRVELRYKDSIGDWQTFESVGNWIVDLDNNPDKIIVISRDLTERQKWEEELVKAKERAEKSAEFKSWFVSAISHEIRTPLNVILGYSNIIKETIAGLEKEIVSPQYFKNIEKAGKRLLTTITQILDISKIEAGEFPVKNEPISLTYSVKSISDLFKIMAAEKKLNLTFDLPEKEILVFADEYCLNGLLTNLLSNAIKYSDSGSIQVSVIGLTKFGRIIVEDQGVGMSKEYLNHLYETFKQEESLKRRYEGAGLGLALTKKYVELINGKIKVESIKNVGTKITVLLPLVKKLVKLEV